MHIKGEITFIVLLLASSIIDLSAASTNIWDQKTVSLAVKTGGFGSVARSHPEKSFSSDILEFVGRGTVFHRTVLRRMAGAISLGSWGWWLCRPFDEDILSEVLSWRDHPDQDLRYLVYQLLALYVENPATPLEEIQQRIKPAVDALGQCSTKQDFTCEKLDELRGALAWRLADDQIAVQMLATNVLMGVRELHSLKLLSLSQSPAALEFLTQNRKPLNNDIAHYDVFCKVAELNIGLARKSDKECVATLKQIIGDASQMESLRSYSVWVLFSKYYSEAVPFLLSYYKSHQSELGGVVAENFWTLIQLLDEDPEIESKLRRLGMEPSEFRFKRPDKVRR